MKSFGEKSLQLNRPSKIKGIAILVTVMSLIVGSRPLICYAESSEEKLAAHKEITVDTNEISGWPDGPIVGAEAAILMEAETGAILYSKNIHMQEYPASTTKILTCLIAAEECSLDEMVTFSHDAVFDTPRDSNHIAIDQGEAMTVEECLEAVLIRSANECAFALAEHIVGGDWEDFAEIMNNRASELGCVDSNFVNPNGLPDDNHYTSAYDLAIIGREFFKNELLCKISITPRLHIYPSDTQPDEIIENSTNQMLQGKEYYYEYLVGSKTGTTEAAGSCLVSCAEKDGMRLICVVLDDVAPYQYTDTIALFDYGFSNFETINVSETESRYNVTNTNAFASMKDVLGNSTPILAINKEDMIVLPKTLTLEDLTTEVTYDSPDPKEAAVITYSFGGQWLGKASVDFTTEGTVFEFDELPSSMKTEEEILQEKEEQRVLFINVAKIAMNAGVVIAIAGIIFLIVRGIIRYRKKHPNWRANWKRERRRRKNRVRHMDIHKSARKQRKQYIISDKRRERGRRKISRRFK